VYFYQDFIIYCNNILAEQAELSNGTDCYPGYQRPTESSSSTTSTIESSSYSNYTESEARTISTGVTDSTLQTDTTISSTTENPNSSTSTAATTTPEITSSTSTSIITSESPTTQMSSLSTITTLQNTMTKTPLKDTTITGTSIRTTVSEVVPNTEIIKNEPTESEPTTSTITMDFTTRSTDSITSLTTDEMEINTLEPIFGISNVTRCPKGSDEILGRCFIFKTKNKGSTWVEARAACQEKGGDLAIIDDCYLMQIVIGFIFSNGLILYLLI